jgi:hypothetical protein
VEHSEDGAEQRGGVCVSKGEDVIWHALAVAVLCLVVFVRGCARAVTMG